MEVNFEGFYQEKRLDLLGEPEVNYIIKNNKLDTNKISDGYHAFGELYEHRIALFIALCREYDDTGKHPVWRSKLHHDGTGYEGWFIMGVHTEKGLQVSYHLPLSKWEETDFAKELPQAPEFDGHTSDDVLFRLKSL